MVLPSFKGNLSNNKRCKSSLYPKDEKPKDARVLPNPRDEEPKDARVLPNPRDEEPKDARVLPNSSKGPPIPRKNARALANQE